MADFLNPYVFINQMAGEQYQEPISYEFGLKIRDLEENNKLMKERMLLIGKNLIDSQEKNNSEITEMKKQIQDLKSSVQRIKQVIESLSEEVAKSARREEVEILRRQLHMFEPLNLVRMEDIEDVINEKLNKHKSAHTSKPREDRHSFWRGKI